MTELEKKIRSIEINKYIDVLNYNSTYLSMGKVSKSKNNYLRKIGI